MEWAVAHPAKLLAAMVGESTALQRVYREAAERRPPRINSQWRVVVAFDEFIPGNKLQATCCLALRMNLPDLFLR